MDLLYLGGGGGVFSLTYQYVSIVCFLRCPQKPRDLERYVRCIILGIIKGDYSAMRNIPNSVKARLLWNQGNPIVWDKAQNIDLHSDFN